MDSPAAGRIVGWMVRLTFREALASRLFWIMSGVTGLCVLVCLSVSADGPPPLPTEPGEVRMRLPVEDYRRIPQVRAEGVDAAYSELTILFGAFRVRYRHYVEDAVLFLQFLLAGFVADAAGVLMALVWTAGFVPGFLEPSGAAVLLGKPVPRWSLLLGKYLGVVVFVGLQAALFVVGTWAALGLRTGVWTPQYLVCVPLLVLHFAVFFSVSTLLAVLTRSTVVSVVGVLAFWMACWAVNNSWHAWQVADASATPVLNVAGYWLLPKPADLNWLLFELLGARDHIGRVLHYPVLEGADASHLVFSLLSSLLFAAGVVACSAYRFVRAQY
jgi:ABC-type transport system involved in multi-copper enzyme maturation permease subunit